MPKPKNIPSIELLNTLVRYDFNTGCLYWKERTPCMFESKTKTNIEICKSWNNKNANCEITTKCQKGYLRVKINGKYYPAHRIAYSLYYNEIVNPDVEIDHKNRNKSDNRIKNLRKATRSQQLQNASIKTNNTSGVHGVNWSVHNSKWLVRIRANGKRIFVGYYDALEEAKSARINAEKMYHKNYAHHEMEKRK
jgi:hypothetical protein